MSYVTSSRVNDADSFKSSDEPNGNITTTTTTTSEPSRESLKQEKEIERLKKHVDRYRSIIQQQEVFIQVCNCNVIYFHHLH